MTNTELDRAVEQAAANEWEAQSKRPNDTRLRLAARSMKMAIDDLDKTLDLINEAAEILEDTPEGDRIASYVGDGENVLAELRKLQETLEGRVSA